MRNNKSNPDFKFLKGPRSRIQELGYAFSVMLQFIKGFRAFHFLGPCATVYGSARYKEGSEYYDKAVQMGRVLAELGLTVMTGGGPGIMEAANRGAKEAGGKSIGCNIVLPHIQKENLYLDKWIIIDYFFVRKILLMKYSYAFVVMPGGYGTLDEFFESIMLMQTKKSKIFPIVLFGTEYHKNLINHIDNMEKEGTISPEDRALFLVTDAVEEAKQHIKKFLSESLTIHSKNRMKPSLLLNERE